MAVELPFGLFIEKVDIFLLVLVRMTGLFVVAPIFGRRNIPVLMKAGFSFMCSLIITAAINFQAAEYNSYIEYALIIAQEFIAGITLGYAAYLILTAVYVAGQVYI